MTDNLDQNQVQEKTNDKEYNFRMQEQKYEKLLAQERDARVAAERQVQERNVKVDEDDDSEPYVDHKKLTKTLTKHSAQVKQETQTEIQRAVNVAIQEERKSNWIKQNGDFYEVLKHAEKLAQKDPDLAESILDMPEGFERQKLVYKNIKALGLHKPEAIQQTIQEIVDANRKSPYYSPSGVGTAPYAGQQSDFSSQGQKKAYEKMQELKSRLRI
jgi:hypothetical protein